MGYVFNDSGGIMRSEMGKVIVCLFKCDDMYTEVLVHPCVTTDIDKAIEMATNELYNEDDFNYWTFVKAYRRLVNLN